MSFGSYLTRPVRLQEVIDRVDVGSPERLSRVILLVSPCRSGSTVLLRVFGAAGVESHYQELKNILRWRMTGGDHRYSLPQRPDETVFLKETLGPYTALEAQFDPLRVLLGAGFPPRKLVVLVLGRAPLSGWASWHRWWQAKTSVETFVLAHETVERIRQDALRQGITTTTLVYEALRDNDAALVIEKLFWRLEVPYADLAVRNWDRLPPFGAPGSHVVFPAEPPQFAVPHLHDSASAAGGLQYGARLDSLAPLGPDNVAMIAQSGLAELYESWRVSCEQDLDLKIEVDPDWALPTSPREAA